MTASRTGSLRLERADLERTGAAIEILYNGRVLPALAGETVAAALAATGVRALRRTLEGIPRGLYCGMGACYECRVTIDGRPGERACMTLVRPGMQVLTEDPLVEARDDPARSVDVREERCAVLVVGAGPAGLAAADAARDCGAEVAILDERHSPGGQYFKPLAASHRFRAGRHTDRQFAAGAALTERVRIRGARFCQQTTVWDARARPEGGVVLHALDAQGPVTWTAEKLIVATGAFERSWPVPGWTLPGVMTTGAAQTLARAYRVAPGRRVLIAGNGPLNFQLAADLAGNGVEVVALAEGAQSVLRTRRADLAGLLRARRDLAWQGAAYLLALRRRGVAVLYRHVLIRVEGDERAQRAVLAAIDADGTVLPGSEKSFDIDAVCTGYGFAPASEITRLLGCRHEVDPRNGATLIAARDHEGRTSIRDVFVAGDAGGAWGAHAALHQGAIAGAVAAGGLAGSKPPEAASLENARRGIETEKAFQASLWRIFSMPQLGDRLSDDDTLVCRCEGVRFGEVRREIEAGASDLAAIKRATRCGMGHCQGRYCSPTIAGMLAGRSDAPIVERMFFRAQAPVRPVPVGALAAARTEQVTPATLVEPAPEIEPGAEERIADVGILVIGAGAIGLSVARELARSGQDVAVLERGLPHAEASGVNAGSLHVQFQTFGFPDLDADAARNAATTLALQRDSVYLWDELANETGTDFEIAIEGGLTVADDAASLAHLRRKVEIERQAGLVIDLLSGNEARVLAPYLSDRIIAASLSRDEGKLNPLKASPVLLSAALSAGARLYCDTRVIGIERNGAGFIVRTGRGTFSARYVVNAAGAWAGSIAALASDSLPVRPNPIQMLVTEALPPTIPYHLAHATRRLTLKQAATGNLVIGGGWKAEFDPCAKRMRPSIGGVSGSLSVVLALLPGLRAAHMIRSWTGIAFTTPPVIGESANVPGLFHMVAQNGMTLGPAIGRVCAGQILRRAPEYDLRPFSPARFGRST